jgi:hypothetical protein
MSNTEREATRYLALLTDRYPSTEDEQAVHLERSRERCASQPGDAYEISEQPPT